MSFLEPLILLSLPLIGLPLLIHLLNQRRHKTAPWAAREFVLQASSLNRGMAQLRHWLILALRSLAIAALIFAISRPLASKIPGMGFLGSPRTQLILMDRSPSMALEDSASGLPWREAGLGQLDQHLQTVGGQKLLFHQLSEEPVPLDRQSVVEMAETSITDTQTNIPELIERAINHIKSQAVGPSDIWVCTDRQAGDWRLDSGRWNRIGQELESMTDVKLHFLTPAEPDAFNLAIAAENVELVRESGASVVYLDFRIEQTSGPVEQRKIPIQIQVGDSERTVDVEMVSNNYRYQQLAIEVTEDATTGGGVIRLPHDSNTADNQFYFAYSPQPPRNSVVVSDNQQVAQLVEAVCSTPLNSTLKTDCQLLPVSGQNEIDWQNTAMVVWHAPLPSGSVAEQMQQFVAGGGTVVFLPTDEAGADGGGFADVKWGSWEGSIDERLAAVVTAQPDAGSVFRVAQWRTEDDLLATDSSGNPVPLKSIFCSRRCGIESDSAVMLASFEDGQPLMVRAATNTGGVYFLATTPEEASSNFTADGIALYVMFHRAVEQGAQSLAGSRQFETGDKTITDTQLWEPVDFSATDASDDRPLIAADQRTFYAGVYQAKAKEGADDGAKGLVIAINRPTSENFPDRVSEDDVKQVMEEDTYELITTSASSLTGLSSEIWRLFMIGMIVALMAEGWLSLPAKSKHAHESETGVAA